MSPHKEKYSIFNIQYSIFIFLFFLFSIPVLAHAEYIESFSSAITVEKDASFTVEETIDYRFDTERHGIFREIPLLHSEKASALYKDRIIDIEFVGVSLDNEPVPSVLEATKDKFVVKIGDPDKTITGAHIYTIKYIVRGGLSYPKGLGTEFYWNVTGNEWQVPIRLVDATLYDKDGIFRSNRSCYRGYVGETGGSCVTSQREDGGVNFHATEFQVGEGMTVAQSLDVVKVAKDIRERTKIWWFIIPLGLLSLVYGGFRMYRYKTAYKTHASIIPQYEPYPGIKPMYTGLVMDGALDARDITACIVYLAEQGYIKIRKTEKKAFFLFEVDDYEMTLVKTPNDAVSTFENKVLEILFDKGLTVGSVISLHELKHDTSAQRVNYTELQALKSELGEDLKLAGFYEHMPIKQLFTRAGIVVLLVLVSGLFLPEAFGGAVFIGFLYIIITFIVLYRRRTDRGYEVQDYLKGFKLFLNTTERDRYTFHNAPEKSPEQFMEFLPYAIAFGVEEKWAKVFESITIPNPDWYDGGSVGAFSSTNLTTSLGAFSSAFSASSGTSASSGGGSSGGGSGGGGGGSW